MSSAERYQQIVTESLLRNDFNKTDEAVYAYSCGFCDGVSWLGKRCAELGIVIPDIELFYTEETS
jgi:hypothetical protein